MMLHEQSPLSFRQPPLIRFGVGCMIDAARALLEEGARAVALVTSKSVVPLALPLQRALETGGARVQVISDIPPEPSGRDFARASGQLSGNLDAVVGLGGGSVLDVAKLLAVLHRRTEPVSAFFGIGLIPARRTRLVCIPTTAGTGSEVSPNSILYDENERLKKGIVGPSLVPDAAYVDPALTRTLPPALTAATGLDALVHCIEAYANRHAHPLVDVHALAGIRLIASNLLRAVQQGDDLEARSRVALGSLHGGLCLGPVNTAAVHALAYPLGSEFKLPHGLSNAVLLPHVLRFNLPATPRRYAEIADALGVARTGDDLATAIRGVDHLAALSRDCGIPQTLEACGVPRAALPRLAAAAMTVTRLLKNNPRELTQAEAEKIYEEAF